MYSYSKEPTVEDIFQAPAICHHTNSKSYDMISRTCYILSHLVTPSRCNMSTKSLLLLTKTKKINPIIAIMNNIQIRLFITHSVLDWSYKVPSSLSSKTNTHQYIQTYTQSHVELLCRCLSVSPNCWYNEKSFIPDRKRGSPLRVADVELVICNRGR